VAAGRNNSARIILKARDDASAKIRVVRGVLGALGVTAVFVGSVQLGRVLVRGVKAAVEVFKEFDAKMAGTAAILRKTKDNIRELTDQAKLLGRTTQFTARQVADGQFTLAKAGFEVNEIFSATPGVINLAAAAEVSVGQAADIAAGLVRGFGLEANQTADIADLLAIAATSAKTDISELADGFKFAVAPARSLGVSATELAASMAVLSDNMLGGSIGGTGLKRAFATMLGQVNKLEGATGLQGLEQRLFTVNEEGERIFIGLVPALRLLKDAGIDAGEAYRTFGLRSGAIVDVLLKNIDVLEETGQAFEGRLGAAADLAAGKLDSLAGDTIKLDSALEGLQEVIGEKLNPGLRALTQDFTVITNAMTDAGSEGDSFLRILEDVSDGLFSTAEFALKFADIIQIAFRSNVAVIKLFVGFLLEQNTKLAGIMTTMSGLALMLAKTSGLPTKPLALVNATLAEALIGSEKWADSMVKGAGDSTQAMFDVSLSIRQTIKDMEDARELAAALRFERSDEFVGPPRRLMNPPGSDGATADTPDALGPQTFDFVGPPALTFDQQRTEDRSQQDFVDEFFGGSQEEAASTIASVFEEIASEELRQREELIELRIGLEEEWSERKQELEIIRMDAEFAAEIENAESIGAETFLIDQRWKKESDALDREFSDRREARAERDAEKEQTRQRRLISQNLRGAAQIAGGMTALFGVKKEVLIAETIVNTAAAVVEALPNYALAIAVALTGAAELAVIQSTNVNNQAFARGGIVSGPPGIDRVSAQLTAGETVLDTTPSEARELLEGRLAIGAPGAGGIVQNITVQGDVLDADEFFMKHAQSLGRGLETLADDGGVV